MTDFDEEAERASAFARLMAEAREAVDLAETAEEAAMTRAQILHRMRVAELRLAVLERLGRSADECQRIGCEDVD